MANRELDLPDSMWQTLRGIVAEYDVKVITATAPRRTSNMPQFTPHDVIIIDYINVLGKSCFKKEGIYDGCFKENSNTRN